MNTILSILRLCPEWIGHLWQPFLTELHCWHSSKKPGLPDSGSPCLCLVQQLPWWRLHVSLFAVSLFSKCSCFHNFMRYLQADTHHLHKTLNDHTFTHRALGLITVITPSFYLLMWVSRVTHAGCLLYILPTLALFLWGSRASPQQQVHLICYFSHSLIVILSHSVSHSMSLLIS